MKKYLITSLFLVAGMLATGCSEKNNKSGSSSFPNRELFSAAYLATQENYSKRSFEKITYINTPDFSAPGSPLSTTYSQTTVIEDYREGNVYKSYTGSEHSTLITKTSIAQSLSIDISELTDTKIAEYMASYKFEYKPFNELAYICTLKRAERTEYARKHENDPFADCIKETEYYDYHSSECGYTTWDERYGKLIIEEADALLKCGVWNAFSRKFTVREEDYGKLGFQTDKAKDIHFEVYVPTDKHFIATYSYVYNGRLFENELEVNLEKPGLVFPEFSISCPEDHSKYVSLAIIDGKRYHIYGCQYSGIIINYEECTLNQSECTICNNSGSESTW